MCHQCKVPATIPASVCPCDCRPRRVVQDTKRTALEVRKVYCSKCSHRLV